MRLSGSRTLNMTTGSPLALLAIFSLPLLLGNLFQQAYNLAASIIVGRFIGAGALASVGATSSLTFLFFSVCSGIGSGAGIVTAQLFGADDAEGVKRSIANSAYLMFGTALVMGFLAYTIAPSLLARLGTPEDILPGAVTYMRVSCLGVPLIAVYNYASSMLRALGDSRTPLIFLVVACLLNVLLDLVFVITLQLGVFGAALATVLGQLIAGAGCLLYAILFNPYFRLQREHFAFDRQISISCVRLGIPLALQWSLIAVSTTALQRFVNSFGSDAVAAFTATSRVETLIQQPFGSLGAALATYAGQNTGAGKLERIRQGLFDSILAMAVFSACMFALMQLLSPQIVRIFVSDPDVISLGQQGLKLTSWFYLFLGLIYVTRGTLNGIGDAVFSFINGIVEVICRIGLPLLVVQVPGVGVWGIWWTAGLTWVISALACCLRYAAWTRKKAPRLFATPLR